MGAEQASTLMQMVPGVELEAQQVSRVEVSPSKLGGLGLVARRKFLKGEVLLVDRPFLTVIRALF